MVCMASLFMGSYRRSRRPAQAAWRVPGQFLGQLSGVDIMIPAAVRCCPSVDRVLQRQGWRIETIIRRQGVSRSANEFI